MTCDSKLTKKSKNIHYVDTMRKSNIIYPYGYVKRPSVSKMPPDQIEEEKDEENFQRTQQLDIKSVNRSNFNWSTLKTEDNVLAKFTSKSQTNVASKRNPNNLYSLYKVQPKKRNVKSNYMNKRSGQ